MVGGGTRRGDAKGKADEVGRGRAGKEARGGIAQTEVEVGRKLDKLIAFALLNQKVVRHLGRCLCGPALKDLADWTCFANWFWRHPFARRRGGVVN